VILRAFKGLARFLSDPVDMGFIDGISKALAASVKRSAESLRRIQNGFVRSYALSVLLGVVAILGYLLFK
jgi:NADH-quinone oxidoreductase subunit L